MMKCPNTTNFSLYKLHCNYPPGLIIPLLPLKLQPLPITRLTAVRPSTLLLLFLVAAQTRAQLDVDAWRRLETEAFGYFDEIEFVDVEDGAEGVGGVGLEVGAVAVFCGLFDS